MCYFPNIQYINEFVPLERPLNHLPKSPKGMFTNLVNKGIVNPHFLDGINNMCDLENEIFNLIDHYPENGASLERVFHLIQIWGGIMGKGIYNMQEFNWSIVVNIYRPFVYFFRSITFLDDATLLGADTMISAFYDALHEAHHRGMNVAFITKHSRFWMHRNMPDQMLPIYDRTFSIHVMQKGPVAKKRDLLPYWRAMINKAKMEHVSLTALERQLFDYFR